MLKIIKRYFSSYSKSIWIPFVTMVCVGILLIIQSTNMNYEPLSLGLLLFYLLTLIGILVVAIYQFINKLWLKGVVNLLLFPLSSGVALIVFGLLIWSALLHDENDTFGKDIIIPSDMKVSEVTKGLTWGLQDDTEGNELISVCETQSLDDENTPQIENITYPSFTGKNRDILLRHLASSAKWRLWEEHGNLLATRRFVVNGNWQTALNGFFSSISIHPRFSPRPWVQTRILIAPDSSVSHRFLDKKTTYERVGTGIIKINLKQEQGQTSYLVLESGQSTIEIMEQTPYRKRSFTQLALQLIKNEFESVLKSEAVRSKGFDPSLMPVFSVKMEEPAMQIRQDIQPGIYFVDAFVNPGSKGCIYLKVFEATKNTPLSADSIKHDSNEYIGWSDNPRELFFYNTLITVYEGGWDWTYPARFELWFKPEDPAIPEIKLTEKIFRIYGWDR